MADRPIDLVQMEKCAAAFSELFAGLCNLTPREIVIAGMAEAFGTCSFAAGVERDRALSMVGFIFDDLERHLSENSTLKRKKKRRRPSHRDAAADHPAHKENTEWLVK